MDTLVVERNDRLFLVSDAHVVRTAEEFANVAPDYASQIDDWEVEVAEANPYIKWISGKYVESGKPNTNKQFWTSGDLSMAEYSIRYAPLNMVHRVRQPIGFYLSTRKIFADEGEAASEDEQDFTIEALSGLWSHIFPFESAMVDTADAAGKLFYSMECVGTHITCGGPEGCGETFEYAQVETHCEHLKERASVRHIVNPTFRGGALIVPPVKPGWTGANATIYQEALVEAASKYAEATEAAYASLVREGSDLSPGEWEGTMAAIMALAE